MQTIYADLPRNPHQRPGPLAEGRQITGRRSVRAEKYPDPVRVFCLIVARRKDRSGRTLDHFRSELLPAEHNLPTR